jgi:hypothetical protein
VPSIAQLLASTGEFTGALKRYDDTDLLISTFAENGYDSAVGRAAIRRMNQIHGRFLKERSRFQTPVKRGSAASHRSVRPGATWGRLHGQHLSEETAYLQRLLEAL